MLAALSLHFPVYFPLGRVTLQFFSPQRGVYSLALDFSDCIVTCFGLQVPYCDITNGLEMLHNCA